MPSKNRVQFANRKLDVRHPVTVPQSKVEQQYSEGRRTTDEFIAELFDVDRNDSMALAEPLNVTCSVAEEPSRTTFLWLEVTGKCQRECEHCYAESGPTGTHGTMNEADWRRVIDEGAKIGVSIVQFIGGEPTLNPALPRLIRYALDRGIKVEVFSNLERVKPDVWEAVSQHGVRLATSYYSCDSAEHDAIVRRRGSYGRTRNNIAEALTRGIPVRVGIIGVREGQNIDGAVRELQELGVPEADIGIDYLRQVGRGVRNEEPSTDQLCGNCANGVLAILPDGSVQPCVFSRWSEMRIGDVHQQSLGDVVGGERLRVVRSNLIEAFAKRHSGLPPCPPNGQPCPPTCAPNCLPNCWPGCQPNCGPSCSPSCVPMHNCRPTGG